MGIRFGLQRHFLLKGEFDIISDGEFSKSNQIFEAAIVELKRQGLGKVDHHIPISKEDLEKIQSSYNPSSPDPKCQEAVLLSFSTKNRDSWKNQIFWACLENSALVPRAHVTQGKTNRSTSVTWAPGTRLIFSQSDLSDLTLSMRSDGISVNPRFPVYKDVRANCFCASLLRTKFTGHVMHRARAR